MSNMPNMPETLPASPAPGAQRMQHKAELRERLSKTINAIERRPIRLCEDMCVQRAAFGISELDRALDPAEGKGIVINGLHEIRVACGLDAASGAGFALCLGLIMTAASGGTQQNLGSLSVFWICDGFTRREYGGYYGPGLRAFGLAPQDLVRICPANLEESLWAAGEVAATRGAARFCLMEIRGHPKALDLTVTRRLMLRAEASGTPVIILRQSGEEEASSALTRWHVKPAVSQRATAAAGPLMHQFIGPPAFTVSLEKCRGGNAHCLNPLIMEWNRNDQCLVPANTRPVFQTVSAGKGAGPVFGKSGYSEQSGETGRTATG